MADSAPRREDVVAARIVSLVVDIENAAKALGDGDPGGVHDLRVAIRGVRSCLRTFRPLLDREQLARVTGGLKWMANMLGTARDAEVLARRLERRIDELDTEERMGPVRRELVGGCRATADAGRASVVDALASARYPRLLSALSAVAADPPYRADQPSPDDAALRRCVRKEVRRVDRLADQAERAEGVERDVAFHETRKAAKRARYAAECIVPVAPKQARRLARRFEAIQDVLGERQDAAVTRRFLVNEGARVGVQPAHNGFTYGVLEGQERSAIRAAERQWPRVRHKASRKKVRRFLKT